MKPAEIRELVKNHADTVLEQLKTVSSAEEMKGIDTANAVVQTVVFGEIAAQLADLVELKLGGILHATN